MAVLRRIFLEYVGRERDFRSIPHHLKHGRIPPTDDRPFFYYTLRPADFLRGGGPEKTGFDDRGAQILRASFAVLAFMTLAFLVLPTAALRGLPDFGRGAVVPLSYAAAVGVGYIALEIGCMKRLTLFLGHPIYAASATLLAFLVVGLVRVHRNSEEIEAYRGLAAGAFERLARIQAR